MAAFATNKTPRCHLLELPAELRNRIYRFTLVEESGIAINHFDPVTQPALLHACHQTRAEARAIYYLENKFYIEIVDFDATNAVEFHRQATGLWSNYKKDSNFAGGFKYDILYHDNWSWYILKNWLKLYYDDHVSALEDCYCSDKGNMCCAVVRLFELVQEMSRSPWSKISAVLEIFKDAIEEQAFYGHSRRRWKFDNM